MKAVIIARVSTEEQSAGNSLPAQIVRLESYCEERFWSYQEIQLWRGAYKTTEEFDRILDYIIGLETVAVCFDKVDGYQKCFIIVATFMKSTQRRVELHFPSDGQVISSKISAVEKFQFGISRVG